MCRILIALIALGCLLPLVAAWCTDTNSCSALRGCPEGFMGMAFGSGGQEGCYRFFGKETTFDDAQQQCEELNANVVSIRNEDENIAVFDLFASFQNVTEKPGYWISYKRNENKEWEWIDGKTQTYTNWNRGEPSDTERGNRDCADVAIAGDKAFKQQRWTARPCDKKHPFFCKIHLTTVV